jgi:ribosomal protein L37AE/L43A
MLLNDSYSSTRMNEIEQKFKKPLPELLVQMQNDLGKKGTCDALGISKASLGYWNLRCGVKVAAVAYMPETQEVTILEKNS